MSDDTALGALASRQAREQGPRPFVTFYDDASGERTELSHATFHNWTSKTANLLVDELDLEPGDGLHVGLGAHWIGLVVVVAAWRAGLTVVIGAGGAEAADAAVVAEQDPTAHDRRLVVGAGMAGRARGGVGDALVFGDEVLAFGDDFADTDVDPDAPALRRDGHTPWSHRTLCRAAAEVHRRLDAPGRWLTTLALDTFEGVVCGPVAALVTGGSTVLVAHPDEPRLLTHADAERTEAVLVPAARASGVSGSRVHGVRVAADGTIELVDAGR